MILFIIYNKSKKMSLRVYKQQSKENLKSASDMKFAGGHYS